MNQLCLQTYQTIDSNIKYQRGLLSALRTNPENLTDRQRQRRDQYLEQQPAIAAVYAFKQELHQLLMQKHRKAWQCQQLIHFLGIHQKSERQWL